MRTYSFICLILIICIQCTDTTNPLSNSKENGIAFYFLEDTTLSIQEALNEDIKILDIQSKPWLTSNDISIYDFSTHLIYLNGDKNEYIPEFENKNNEGLVPFVIKAKSQPVYVGALYTKDMSFVPNCPTIQGLLAFTDMYPKDVIHLANFLPSDQLHNDIRNNEDIKDALIQSSIFHGGITVKLDSISIMDNAEISTISYIFTYENNDVDDLYVLDPNLVTSEVFHCFSSGIIFRDKDLNSIIPFYQDECSLEFPYIFNPALFVKLGSKEKLSRTVILRGYPDIPSGKYSCEFYMFCLFQIELSQRYFEGGRYWLGYLQSNQKDFNF